MLVPSGKIRLMVRQAQMQNDQFGMQGLDNGTDSVAAKPKPRGNVQQKNLGDPAGGNPPAGQPPTEQEPMQPGQLPQQIPQVDPEVEKQKMQVKEKNQDKVNRAFSPKEAREYYKQVCRQHHLFMREISPNGAAKLFTFSLPDRNGIWHGSFYIPGKTFDGKEVDPLLATQIRDEICKKYHMTPADKTTTPSAGKGSGYIVQWSTEIGKTDTNQFEDDASQYAGEDIYGGNNENKQPIAKASSGETMGEMLTDRKDALYKIMRKIAKGEH